VAENSTVLTLTINGAQRTAEIDTRLLLVEALRECFGTRGPKVGCATGDCGACTVSVDGQITKSCLRLAVSAEGCEVLTLEGLAGPDGLSPLQEAFWDQHGFQCGFCLSGMLFAARELLERNPAPSDTEIRAAISGNLCRCTGYEGIVASVRSAADVVQRTASAVTAEPGTR
jgi:aerobic-type carbon monoxide dehydrogenase small subunit (CoxS/CutS family)